MRIARSLDGWCPYCPYRAFTSYSFTPTIRTCKRCNNTYIFEESDMPICSVCQQGYTSCACYPSGPRPKPGQWIKLTRKFKSGLIETWEGPVSDVIWDDDPRIVRSVRIGDQNYRRTFNLGTQESGMIEPGSWEIVIPAEPPNKSVWVCPAGNEGKLAIWRRLDHLVGATGGKWFYPGSVNGATWEQIYNTGPGYLLEAKNG